MANGKRVDTRRRAVQDFPRPQLELKHTESGKLLPDRESLLDRLPKGATVAEIGVAEGRFSRKIINRTEPARLHLIDSWSVDRYKDGRREIEEKFSDDIEQQRVIVHQGISVDVLQEFSTGSLDWAYIDTDHSYATTAEELRLCSTVVSRDGLIAGHDFCTGNVVKPVVYGVIQAVNEFCVEAGWKYEYISLDSSGHFSFCLSRI